MLLNFKLAHNFIFLKYLKNFFLDLLLIFYCNFSVFLIMFFLSFFFVLNINKRKVIISNKNNTIYKLFIINTTINNLSNFLLFLLFFIFYFLFFLNNSFKFSIVWFNKNYYISNKIFDLTISFDYINVYFIILTFFIFSFLFLSLKNSKYMVDFLNIDYKIVFFLFIIIQIFLILTFATSNIFFFFFFFECSLMPLYFLVLQLGKGVKKKHYASLSLIFFTLSGSVFLLFGILYLFTLSNSCDFKNINYELLDFNTQIILFIVFMLGFCVKIPIFPFYSWLPEAHVEAATSISILLAAIFLKVATYGVLKIIVFNFIVPINYLYSVVFYFSVMSILIASLLNIVQTDLKKIIALSSVIHMNYIVIGLFSLDSKSIVASLIYMFSHAFVSTGLFFLVGLFYENTGTRDLLNYSNYIKYSQNLFVFLLLFNLANISFPLTISFISELMLLNNLIYLNIFFVCIILFSIFISVIYTFWMLHNIFYGKNTNIKNIVFLNIFDIILLAVLLFVIFLFGCLPFIIFYNLEQEIYLILIKKFFIF